METKRFTQFGTFSIALLLPLLALFIFLLIRSALGNGHSVYLHLFIVLICLLGLLTFYKLTIVVTSTHISFKLGIGLIRKSYGIKDLKRCIPIVNSAFHGIGIHAISNGWLYNVSGLKSIELQFVNSKSIVRIGTNSPDEISQLVQSIITQEVSGLTSETRVSKWITPLYVLGFILILSLAVFPFLRETKVTLSHNSLRIRGVYGETISYANIELIDTVCALPKIIMRTNGYALGSTLIGNFRTQDNRNVKLFVKKKSGPYILIKSSHNKPIYLNYESKQKTTTLFNDIKTRQVE